MISAKRIKEASSNFSMYLQDGLIKKEKNETAKQMYLENAEMSLSVSENLLKDSLKPYLWVIVCSYYSMFYIANAVLLNLGYKVGENIAHKVTTDALIVLVLGRLKKELLSEFEKIQEDALELASARAESVVGSYDLERAKRSRFQYDMGEKVKSEKARTSLLRAKEFMFELKKIMI